MHTPSLFSFSLSLPSQLHTIFIFIMSCIDPNNMCPEEIIRLVGGNFTSEGRVELCINNHWGTICDDRWSNQESAVVCNSLGYSGERLALPPFQGAIGRVQTLSPVSRSICYRLSPSHHKPLSLSGLQETILDCPGTSSLEGKDPFGSMKRTVSGMSPVCWTAPIWALALATAATARI